MYRMNSPFDEMFDIVREFDCSFPGKLSGPVRRRVRVPAERREGARFVPAVESFSHDDRLVLRAELPGVEPSEVDVTVHEGRLVLKGEKKVERESGDDDVHISEIRRGTFERSFTLPEDVDSDKIDATFRNGVLEIRIPRAPRPEPRSIPVATGDGSGRKAA